ncbi:MAG: phosphoadenosine phosphosulfate reductase [Ilumatobacteraceae bacterium]
MTLRTISYGGGVQSTALCVLATQGKLGRVDAALFANVGDDSEHPATLEFVRNTMIPWAAERGLSIHELARVKRDGSTETLWGRLMKPDSRSLPIPVRMSNGAPGNRQCTSDFKIKVVAKWLKANGASGADPADVMIGISTDEIQRVGNKRVEPYERPMYPLIDLGLSRTDCAAIIARAGLPVPPKSSCFFCPFHRPQTWAEMRRDEPELFERSVQLEDTLNERRSMLGRDPVWLTRFNRPLAEAVQVAQTELPFDGEFGDGACDEGYCWT